MSIQIFELCQRAPQPASKCARFSWPFPHNRQVIIIIIIIIIFIIILTLPLLLLLLLILLVLIFAVSERS